MGAVGFVVVGLDDDDEEEDELSLRSSKIEFISLAGTRGSVDRSKA